MRRSIAAAAALTLFAAPVVATLTALPAHAAVLDETTLYLHSDSGSYAQDAAADPGATASRAPKGSTTSTTPPTGADDATATFQTTGVSALGAANYPSFSLAAAGDVRAICFDLWVETQSAAAFGQIDTAHSIFPGDGGGSVQFAPSPYTQSPYQGGVVHMRYVAFPPNGSSYPLPAGSAIGFSSYIDADQDWTLHYDSTTHPSSITLNPTTCGAGQSVSYPAGDADPQGLQFSPTVVSDPQRDEGEPAVTTDRAGTLYTCGPSGSSQIADFAQVSTDGGDQFHLLGTPPRGQISTPPHGGGDCALATAPKPNSKGNYQLAYAGLGPLTQFSTFTSADAGRTLVGSPDQ